jgi:hypothetical protein
MEFPVHLRCSAVVAIVDCPDQGQFIGLLSLKQAALQSIWVFSGVPNWVGGSGNILDPLAQAPHGPPQGHAGP